MWPPARQRASVRFLMYRKMTNDAEFFSFSIVWNKNLRETTTKIDSQHQIVWRKKERERDKREYSKRWWWGVVWRWWGGRKEGDGKLLAHAPRRPAESARGPPVGHLVLAAPCVLSRPRRTSFVLVFFPLVASPRYANSPASKLLLTASARPCVVNSVRVRQDAVATRTDPDGRPACSAGRWIVQRRPAAQAPKSQNRIDRILQQQQQRPFRCKSRPNFYFPESKFVRSLNSTGGDATVGVRFVRRNLRCALTWAPARAPLAIALRFWTISFQGKKNFFSFFRSPSEGPGFFFDFFVPTRCDLAKKWNFFFKKKKRGGKIV